MKNKAEGDLKGDAKDKVRDKLSSKGRKKRSATTSISWAQGHR